MIMPLPRRPSENKSMKTLLKTTLLFITLSLSFAASDWAQTSPALPVPASELRKFLQFDDGALALIHARVIDGNGGAAQEDRIVIVRNGKIAALGDAALAIPSDARVLDMTGRTVIPGLVGMHNHLMYTASINLDEDDKLPPPGFLVTELAFSAPRLYLAAGVTTMRTTGSIEPYTDLNIRRMIDELKMPGPHIDVTGPYLEGKDSIFPQMLWLNDAEHARKSVAFWATQGVTSLKAYINISEAELRAGVQEAHKQGLKLTGHLCSVDYRQAAALGIDNLEHGPVFTDSEFVPNRKPDVCPSSKDILSSWEKMEISSPQVRALIQDLVKNKVAITSTLPVFESFITTRPLLSKRQSDMLAADSLRSYLNARSSAATNPARAIAYESALKKEMAFERAFVAAGGLLMAGPDPTGNGGVLPGFGDQRGLQLLVEAGFTPSEAIQIASANGARYMGQFAQFGSVEVGKRADLVIIKGNPARNIKEVENVEMVIKDGRVYDPAKLISSVRGMVGIR
jgi:imidazolonepropionase-like amidohydrolase